MMGLICVEIGRQEYYLLAFPEYRSHQGRGVLSHSLCDIIYLVRASLSELFAIDFPHDSFTVNAASFLYPH